MNRLRKHLSNIADKPLKPLSSIGTVKGFDFKIKNVVYGKEGGLEFCTGWIQIDGKANYISIPLALVEIKT